jgi:hypothetical protein
VSGIGRKRELSYRQPGGQRQEGSAEFGAHRGDAVMPRARLDDAITARRRARRCDGVQAGGRS